MKELFPEYNHSDSLDYSTVWKNALFVFDTNVLLNLYRYHEGTRTELLEILKNLKDRIWIPHHVALEFHRNRISVIATQGNGFKEIREILNNTTNKLRDEIYQLGLHNRHTLINAENLIKDVETLKVNFIKELANLEGSQQKINDPDPIKNDLDDLFLEKVGPAYTEQKRIDELSKLAETRYKLKIPPGYKDDPKDKNKPDDFIHNGVIYKRKYGDYIAWNQILEKAQTLDSKQLIFVTDDGKEDWWYKLNAEGSSLNLGPRVELIDEAIKIGDLKAFLMYKPEGFLKYAKEFLAATVSDESLNEARQVSTTNTQVEPTSKTIRDYLSHSHAESAVHDWLQAHFTKVNGPLSKFPEFIVEHEDETIGIELLTFKPSRPEKELRIFKQICTLIERNSEGIDEFVVFWVIYSEEDKDILIELLEKMENRPPIHIGLLELKGNIPKITRSWPLPL